MIEFGQLLCYLVGQSQQRHHRVGTRAITGGGVPRRKRHYGPGIEVEVWKWIAFCVDLNVQGLLHFDRPIHAGQLPASLYPLPWLLMNCCEC